MDEKTLEQMLLSFMKKHPRFSAAPPGEPSEPELPPVQAVQAIHTEDDSLGATPWRQYWKPYPLFSRDNENRISCKFRC